MLIVIEGCDGVGKTSLARDLCALVGAEYRHLSAPKRHPLEECVLDLDAYRPGDGKHVVVDRFHIGEMVYGPRYRGVSQLGLPDGPAHRWIDLYLRSRGALLVHVFADLETVVERVGQRGDDMVDVADLEQLLDAYVQALATPLCETVDVKVPGVQHTRMLDFIRVLAGGLEDDVAPVFDVTDRFLGFARPNVLYVGDETSPTHLNGKRPLYRAPFVPYDNTSGYYLFEALPRRALQHAAFVNSAEVDLVRVHEALGLPTVVALGRHAARALDAASVPYLETRHPQYVRRFHHSKLAAWGAHVAGLVEGKEVAWL